MALTAFAVLAIVLIDFSVNLDELPAIAEKAGIAGFSAATMVTAAVAIVAAARNRRVEGRARREGEEHHTGGSGGRAGIRG